MAAPTPDDLRKIIETDLDDSTLDSYISDAYYYLEEIVGYVNETVQKWMAAHLLAASRERQAKQGEAGGAGVTYAGSFGRGLSMTTYGQMAMSMDSSGKLATSSDKKIASITAVEEDYG